MPGASVAEWLRSLAENHLPVPFVGSKPSQGRIFSCNKDFHLAYGRSVVLPRCLLVTEIMLEGASGVFLHHESWTSPYDLSC